ncbi:MAG: class IV adenylate cyclase [Peptoniphilaceae bacterium]|nr:class IV adenylate cyclase [Peptoniphilaceae bacterium]MDY6085991.1 class IV adenylate cyclase [Peptoniphilaceae bacterium]
MTEPEREVEVKLLGLDRDALERTLQAQGATFDREEHQINVRLSNPAHPLPEAEYLRLRTIEVEGEAPVHELTLKRRVSKEGARVNEEYTVHVDDPEAALLLMEKLGFSEKEAARKTRRRYLWQDFRVEFDTWDADYLPVPYVEVEAPSPEALEGFLAAFQIPSASVSTLSIGDLRRTVQNERHDA